MPARGIVRRLSYSCGKSSGAGSAREPESVLQRECRNAFAEHFAGQLVFFVYLNIRRFLSGFRHDAAPTAETIDAVRLCRHFGEADPNHAMLHRERVEVLERAEFVTARSTGNSEAGSEFVAPLLLVPSIDRRISECLELCRRTTHVSRATEDDGVTRFKRAHDFIVLIAAVDDAVAADGDETCFHAADGRRAFVNSIRQFRRMA
jgi:hypothetical protein